MTGNVILNHAVLLKDKIRMEAYKKAIEHTVKEGDVVVDIGCGLGILSFLAIKAGAKHVHAIDVDPATLNLAKTIAKMNGFDKKITFHKGFSSRLKLKEPADVIVSELFGNLGFNENCLPVLIDARQRLLKKDGKMIPFTLNLAMAPCYHKDWEFTAKAMHNIYGVDFLPDSPDIDLGFPSVTIKHEELLADSIVFAETNFYSEKQLTIEATRKFQIVKDGIMTGFAGWFETYLTETINFNTSPSSLTTHWKQGFLPLRAPEKVKAGQKVELSLEMAPDASGLNSVVGYHYRIQ